MNIFLLNDYAFLEGGASRIALTQAELLSAIGHNVVLFSGMNRRGGERDSGWVAGGKVPTWLTGQQDIATDNSRLRAAAQGLWNQQAATQLEGLLKGYDTKNTVVLVHSWSKLLSSSVVQKAAGMGYCVVAVLHDYFIGCPNGAYHDFQAGRHCWRKPMSLACIGANCDRHSYAQKLWRVTRQAIQENRGLMPRCLSAVICVSEYQKHILSPWLIDNTPCHVLTNPVIEPPADVSSLPEKNTDFTFVGRLSPEKGAMVFAKASKLANTGAVFVGDGPEQANLIKELPSARFTGWLSDANVMREVAQARALVFPSVWHETFGLSVYEAAALGVPSIVASETASADFVEDGVNGLLFKSGDSADLAEKLIQLQSRPEYSTSLGAQARKSYEAYFESTKGYGRRLEMILRNAMTLHDAGSSGSR